MNRLLFVGFAFLAFAFYVLSDGRSFDPTASRDRLVEQRTERENARIAALPTPNDAFVVARTTSPAGASQATSVSTTESVSAPLNLASFEDVSTPEPELEPETSALLLSERTQQRPLPTEIIPETELSRDALDTTSAARQDIAFAGNTTSAASGRVDTTVDIRTVKGSRVNMRSGPGTDFDVIDQLGQATQVEILTNSGDGWVELRPVNGGATGWIAEFLLSDG
ncbi:MAG: SH3 domain-containing protein [Roseobacter sp.]